MTRRSSRADLEEWFIDVDPPLGRGTGALDLTVIGPTGDR
jgi:hypothetical protein